VEKISDCDEKGEVRRFTGTCHWRVTKEKGYWNETAGEWS